MLRRVPIAVMTLASLANRVQAQGVRHDLPLWLLRQLLGLTPSDKLLLQSDLLGNRGTTACSALTGMWHRRMLVWLTLLPIFPTRWTRRSCAYSVHFIENNTAVMMRVLLWQLLPAHLCVRVSVIAHVCFGLVAVPSTSDGSLCSCILMQNPGSSLL